MSSLTLIPCSNGWIKSRALELVQTDRLDPRVALVALLKLFAFRYISLNCFQLDDSRQQNNSVASNGIQCFTRKCCLV